MAGEDDDKKLFRQNMRDVKPLDQNRADPWKPKRKPVPEQTRREERAIMDDLLSHDLDPAEVQSGEELVYARAGVQHKIMHKLRRGQYVIEGMLDLHGHTVAEAADALRGFLHEAHRNGRRCVRIIHGKGLSSPGRMPVLKAHVNSWLRQRDDVLAFCSALPSDGGTGAVYVLLRKAGKRQG